MKGVYKVFKKGTKEWITDEVNNIELIHVTDNLVYLKSIEFKKTDKRNGFTMNFDLYENAIAIYNFEDYDAKIYETRNFVIYIK